MHFLVLSAASTSNREMSNGDCLAEMEVAGMYETTSLAKIQLGAQVAISEVFKGKTVMERLSDAAKRALAEPITAALQDYIGFREQQL